MAKEYVGTETKDVGHRKGQQGKMPNENAKGTRQRNTERTTERNKEAFQKSYQYSVNIFSPHHQSMTIAIHRGLRP